MKQKRQVKSVILETIKKQKMLSAVRLTNLSIRLLLSACVIFWPNTVRSPSLAASNIPVSASRTK